jgi:parallel beta-helix repeat protein
MAQTVYVNSGTGSDSAAGNQSAPFKTITKALKSAQSGTTIQLAAGNYNAASGEVFPLDVPSGVKIVGSEDNKGNGVSIEGSGQYLSRTQAGQNVTILLADNAELRGVTVTNPANRGSAVWVESTAPTIANCTFTKSKREGVFATGDAKPVILNNDFIANDGNGISITRNTTGEIRGNTCKKTGTGISIDSTAAPKVVDNALVENRYGIIISGESRPVLRGNRIESNTAEGLTVTSKAVPDLGSSQDPGKNTIRNNGQYDVNNASSTELIFVGNELSPAKVRGKVRIDGVLAGGGGGGTGTGGDTNTGGGTGTGGDTNTGGGTGTGGDTNTGGGTGTGGGTVPKPLTDIKGHWAEPFIRGLYDKGLISGFSDGTFKPDDKMTRAQFAAIVVKAFNPAPKREATKFSDVANDYWAKDVIQQAYRSQFMSGFEDKTFRPNDNVQRVQVVVSLVSGLGLGSSDTSVLRVYSDRNAIPDYAKDEVATATNKEIVVNYPQIKQLNPTKEASRAEVSAMIYQALVDANRVSAVNSDYIVSANTGGDNPPPDTFSDIQNHWAKSFIQGLADEGLIGGFSDGTFKPDDKMTRAQFAAIVVKAFNPAPKRDAAKFSDVADDYWAKDVIQQAYRGQFMSGFEDKTFRPNDNIQRVQVLVSLVNGLGLSASTASPANVLARVARSVASFLRLTASDTTTLNVYDDRNTIPDYAKDEVATATRKQIVVNYPKIKQLNPTKEATRAEVAAMIYQALVDANKVSAVNSDYIVSA